jgi:hypothetical protein
MKMKKLDPKYLPYLASITTAVMLMRAGVEYFGQWGWIIGPLAGIVASLSLAVAGSRITMIAAKRKVLAYLSLAFMLILSPAVIYLSEPNPTWATIAWAAFPDAAILLASVVTGQSLIAQETSSQAPATGTQVASKPRKTKGKVARKAISDNDLLSYLQANAGASQQQVADHFNVTRQAIGQRVKRLYETNQIS